MGLPPRCDKTWFCNTFCAGVEVAGQDCWPYIVSFNMYVCVCERVCACEGGLRTDWLLGLMTD
jgi:hypothetical protein